MSKKPEGNRVIEHWVDKLTVAKCMGSACFNLRKTARTITQLYDNYIMY